jgi:hypothetical protein
MGPGLHDHLVPSHGPGVQMHLIFEVSKKILAPKKNAALKKVLSYHKSHISVGIQQDHVMLDQSPTTQLAFVLNDLRMVNADGIQQGW